MYSGPDPDVGSSYMRSYGREELDEGRVVRVRESSELRRAKDVISGLTSNISTSPSSSKCPLHCLDRSDR